MAVQIKMPQPGNTVTECLLARWCKKAGDTVHQGEVLAEIESDKAAFEIESPENGVLLGTFYQAGAVVPVHTPIGVVGQPGESFETAPDSPSAVQAATAMPQTAPADQSPAPGVSYAGDPTPFNAGMRISPRAAKYASQNQIAITQIQGSGPQGRILERDVIAAHARGETAQNTVLAGGETPGRRRTLIARRMRESLATTAQFTLSATAEATVLLKQRGDYKAAHEKEGRPDANLNELLMFATVKALQAVPELNATFQQGKLYRHADINLGFACDTPQGLLVPVIKKCQELGLLELAAKTRALAQAGRDDSLAPDDLQEGTFTISNLGSFGIEAFTPIINPPQVAILGINHLQLRPVRAGDSIQFREFIGFSLTCDHQVIDGLLGAKFLKTLGEIIEQPDRHLT